MMGRAGALGAMWRWMLAEGFVDDQNALGHYVDKFPEKVKLDYMSEIFYVIPPPASGLSPTYEWMNGPEQHELKTLNCTVTGEKKRPYFLHFAGNMVEGTMRRVLTPHLVSRDTYRDVSQALLQDDAMELDCNSAGLQAVAIVSWFCIALIILILLILGIALYWYWRKNKLQKTGGREKDHKKGP
jgi:hypothetical protein